MRTLRSELKRAEAALKRSKECTEHEIKKAYRGESLKHHPDKGGGEEKFKLVVEAHSVLSDPARRECYNMGEDEDGMGSDMGSMGGMGSMSPMDLSELFAQFHGGSGFGGGVFGDGGSGRRSGFSS
ncbi:predicted protein [Postia placenta Mad-698-R]|nr:predicted protein [Postia placenta Mad-698-R]